MMNVFFDWLKEVTEKIVLDKWDWVAIIISISAFVVAIKTLHSQQRTEQNTEPVVTMKVQRMLWEFLIKQYYYKIQYLHILKIKLESCSFQKRPEESFIRSLCINPENYIHEELFFDEKYDKHYGNVHWIKKHLSDYNLYVNSIANHLDNKNITVHNINRLYSILDDLCCSTLNYYQIIFKVENKVDFKTLLDKELFDKQKDEIAKSGFNPDEYPMEKERYLRDDAFVNYFADLEKLRKIIIP